MNKRSLNILLSIICFLFVAVPSANAQELSKGKIKKFVKKGRKAYRKEEYWKAKSYYDKVTDANTDKAQYWFEAGLAYYDSQVKREDAIVFFEKALLLSVEDTIPEILYYAAKTYHFKGEFEKAIEYYNMFLGSTVENKTGQETRANVIREIEICNNGIDLRSVHLYEVQEIIKLDEKVNSEYLDYAPVISVEEELLLFCSRRPPGKKKHVDGLYFEDIFYATSQVGDNQWSEAQIIDKSSGYVAKEINGGKAHEAPVSVSPDGNTLYIYKENSIWKSTKDKDGKWAIPIRMNQNVNIGEANPSIFITPDETEMFIASTGVKDGLGELDLYYSVKGENGNWKKPVNMGPKINTPYKEDAPYLSKDGKSLYFASQGHNSMGGFDIFRVTRDEDGVWGDPRNIGTPVNSAGDDIYYVENEEGTLAYYASMRPGSYGYLDIYTAKYDCKNIPTTEVKGYAIYSENHRPVNGVIKITNATSGEAMGTFNIDPKTGKYQMVLPPDNTYNLELVIPSSGYTQERPHFEEFYIPRQCEAFNLFQQINISVQKDTNGLPVAQKATFKNALFAMSDLLKEEFDVDFTYREDTNSNIGGIKGNVAHSDTWDGKNIEMLLLNEKDQIVRVTRTNELGDFVFEKLDTSIVYKIMVNEDDAIISYNNWDQSHPSQFYMQGVLYNYTEMDNIPRTEATIYLAKADKILSDMSITDIDGEFEFLNPTTPLGLVEELNDNTTITYNLDQADAEILYSALLTTIDPNDESISYTEHIDLVSLQKMTETDVQMQEFANILFDFDKFFLRQKSEDILQSLYLFMKENPSVQIKLDGHTDWIGTDEYNETLSENRTLKAHKYLIDAGIDPDRIDNAWFGEKTPSVSNTNADGSDNAENRQLNRRVEIKVEIPEMADLYLSL
ncbi:MAG: outer membrane protein OmpA-like peptidoglycan-associated protein [Crocinitomix sp.]|jgi:outer membrane protein OmpA-like peptidoglycan-associated protein/tetratricopeptide (TPR) repeat protein